MIARRGKAEVNVLVAAALLLACGGAQRAGASETHLFGGGANQFSMEFVTIGNPGNEPDTTGSPNPVGTVDYLYDMGKYEVSREMVAKANSSGGLGISLIAPYEVPARPGMPAGGINWNEAARFANWLNAEAGFPPAYKFSSQPGERGYSSQSNILLWSPEDAGYDPSNPFRNQQSLFFIPNADEWYKAAYYDPSKGAQGGYWDYATGSDALPTPVSGGTAPGTAIFFQLGPADITFAGGLSPYGIMAMSGNVFEWQENAYDLVNDDPAEQRAFRGGGWDYDEYMLSTRFPRENPNIDYGDLAGFRIASRATNVLPGDTDGDGDVDLEDLNNVRNHFGEQGSLGDANLDGVVNLEDLNTVRNHFGEAAARPVPEPATWCLAILGVAALAWTWRTRLLKAAICLVSVAVSATAMAESLDWVRQFGGPGSDSGRAVAVDVFGDIYVAGHSSADPNDNLTSDFLLLKYDSSGELLWNRQYDFTKTDRNWSGLSTDAVGNVYFGGSVNGANGDRDAILVKVDTAGNYLWERRLDGGGEETFRNLRTDLNGNVLVSGTTIGGSVDGGGVSTTDAIVGKFDADGNQIWMRQLRGNHITEAWGLEADTSGNVFVSGSAESPFSKILTKLSPTGTLLWDRRFDQDYFGNALSIAVDPAGNAYVAGSTSGGLGGGNAGGLDAFVQVYDGNGNLGWTRQFGSSKDDSIWGVAIGDAGEVFVAGATVGDLGSQNVGNYDAFLGRLSAQGEVQWIEQLGTAASDWGHGVVLGKNGEVFLAGYASASLTGQSPDNIDFFLAKYLPNSPGDTDGDGDVDLADLNAVRNDFGIAGDGIPGDVNDDKVVDLTDLNLVRNHFGDISDARPVPEPYSGVLTLTTLLMGVGLTGWKRVQSCRPTTSG